ncbi:MAG TPA: acyl carrier protein [Propionibacteriaceae bacterium]|jgi:acyl carrier protein
MNMLPIITTVVREYADVPESAINRDTDPLRDLNLTSYDLMGIIGRLESELGVSVAERDVRHLVTLGDLDDYIMARVGR